MRALFFSVAFFLLSFQLCAQTFEVDTVLKNGSINDRINLVFLADGYTASQQDKFITDVNDILDEMFSQTPFKQYKNYFNAYAIKVISDESGANHPKNTSDPDCTTPVAVVNNYFGSTFDYQGIHRLLYPTNLSKVIAVLSANFPLYDQAFVAVNSPYYGGAGGFVATCSDHPNGKDVAMHEIGHSFAGLADEYWAGASFAMEKPNMTKQTDPTLVKWKNWLNVSGVGIYSHSGDASWKKPHTNCKMGVLNAALCKVCSETFVERFHQLVKPISSFAPENKNMLLDPEVEQQFEFSLALVNPEPNTLKITWEKGDVTVANNFTSFSISSLELETETTIRATVFDTTDLTRAVSHADHRYIIEWKISSEPVVTGVEVTTIASQYELVVYPNPSDGDLKFSYTLSKPTTVNVSLIDTNGRKVKRLINESQLSGIHAYTFLQNDLKLASGQYFLNFSFGKTNMPVKVVIR